MKKLSYALIVVLVFFSTATFAQCVIDNANTNVGITPANPSDTITQGIAYSQTLQVYVPTSYSGITIDSIHISSITGAPSGINYVINPVSGTIDGGSNGAICYTGTTNASVGSYPLTFNGTAYITVGIYPSSVPLSAEPYFAYTFNVQAPPPASCTGVQLSTAVDRNNLCSYDSMGQATAHVIGNSSAITYLWSSNPPQTDSVLENVPAGTYYVSVSSGDSICATDSVTVTAPPALGVSLSIDTANCSNSINVTGTGGTPVYSYQWDPFYSGGNIAPGSTYEVTVTDSHSCTVTGSITGDSVALIIINADIAPAACPDYNNGSIALNVSGGYLPYRSYNWSPNVSGPDLTPGSYSVTVTDNHDCTASATFNVGTTAPADSLAVTNATQCNGHSINGSISTFATGGTPGYTYQWDSLSASGPDPVNLSPGTYVVTVTDQMGCWVVDTATVVLEPGVGVTISTGVAACGEASGYAIANTSGGASFTYMWSPGGATTDTIINIAAGPYSVTVTDNGCSASASATVGASQPDTAIISTGTSQICPGDSAYVCVTYSSGNFIAYNWNNGGTESCTYTSYSGNVYVTVTDQYGCTALSNSIDISTYPPPTGQIIQYADTLIWQGSAAVTYQWYWNDTVIPGQTDSIYFASPCFGFVILEMTEGNGCTVKDSVYSYCEGINNLTNNTWAKIYPNPSSSGEWQLAVSSDLVGSAIEIFDVSGRRIYESEIKDINTELNLDVAKGLYLMRVTSQSGIFNLKLTRM